MAQDDVTKFMKQRLMNVTGLAGTREQMKERDIQWLLRFFLLDLSRGEDVIQIARKQKHSRSKTRKSSALWLRRVLL